MRKKVQTLTTVNELTGEVTEQISVYSSSREAEQQYAKIYIGGGIDIFCRSKTESTILQYLISHTSTNGETYSIPINSHIKRSLSAQLDCSVSNIDYALKQLLSCSLICRVSRGTYMLNPYIISRGSWETVRRLRGIYDNLIKKKPAHD